MGRKIRVSTRTELVDAYEVDVDLLLADDYFEDVDLTSEEAVADRIEAWLTDEGDKWSAPWARPLPGYSSGERGVYEVDLAEYQETPASSEIQVNQEDHDARQL